MQTYFSPQQAEFISPAKNDGFDPTQPGKPPVTVMIDCRGGHPARPVKSIGIRANHRILGGCTSCLREGAPSMAEAFPEIAAEWVPGSTPGFTPSNLSSHSNARLWFRCDEHGQYLAMISHRTYNKSGCPDCGRHRTIEANMGDAPRISDHPELAARYMGRNPLPASATTILSEKSFWWKCVTCSKATKQRAAAMLSSGMECRVCVQSESAAVASSRVLRLLSVEYPNFAAELIDERNAPFLAKDIGSSSKKLLWWKCGGCDSEFQRTPASRTNTRRRPDLPAPGEPEFVESSGRCKRCFCLPE